MITTGTACARSRATSSTPVVVEPAAGARVPAAWITGPSASGSEYGMPTSSRSAPPSAHAIPIARDPAASGNPPIRYGIRAARRPSARTASNVARMRPLTRSPEQRERFGEVLVAAAGEADEVERVLALVRVREHPRQRVGGLERRDDALELRTAAERGQRVGVGDRLVARAPRVAQPRVLRPRAGIVEAGRDGVRLEDLAVLVLHDRAEGAVQDAPAAADG